MRRAELPQREPLIQGSEVAERIEGEPMPFLLPFVCSLTSWVGLLVSFYRRRMRLHARSAFMLCSWLAAKGEERKKDRREIVRKMKDIRTCRKSMNDASPSALPLCRRRLARARLERF